MQWSKFSEEYPPVGAYIVVLAQMKRNLMDRGWQKQHADGSGEEELSWVCYLARVHSDHYIKCPPFSEDWEKKYWCEVDIINDLPLGIPEKIRNQVQQDGYCFKFDAFF